MAVHVLNLFVIPALKYTSVKEQVTLLQSFITNPILYHILLKFPHAQTSQIFSKFFFKISPQLFQVLHISFNVANPKNTSWVTVA